MKKIRSPEKKVENTIYKIFLSYKSLFLDIFKYKFIYFNWRLITLQYCIVLPSVQFSSVAQSCLTLCDP